MKELYLTQQEKFEAESQDLSRPEAEKLAKEYESDTNLQGLAEILMNAFVSMTNQEKYKAMINDYANSRNKEAAKNARDLESNSQGLTAEEIDDVAHVIKRTKDCVID